jgi:protein-tyrosine phosphatase
MIDIHNHILPAVDDGAKDAEMALSMLREAVSQNIGHLVLTPHLYEPDIIDGTSDWKNRTQQGFKTVQNLIKDNKLALDVTLAAEVRYQDFLPTILKELPVLIGGKYLLLEFSFHNVPIHIEHVIRELMIQGIVPILAHPERIKPWRYEPDRLERLINMGCLSQVDIGSITGNLGEESQKFALHLLEKDAVHILGSDAHDIERRPILARQGYEWIKTKYGKDYADLLLKENGQRILAGKTVFMDSVDLSYPKTGIKSKLKQLFNTINKGI